MIGKLKDIFEYIFDAYIIMVKVLLPGAEFESSIAVDELAFVLATLRTVGASCIV
ncbi:hypothetical protein [Bartonella doshiae]|uniref:Uncharacterized protein n=2 Tax=Bartonella doshiae TaxID=33044 RepID=A0A380ZFC3_BARDO|nr:hypothetical protein [Bartonella doshiae]EJF80562.1 hypothetical protein MCS_01212 [Bartonella doshiae NCTC 12862 = ATCC 700133]MBB6158873.1 hypothetical protein [Bartonella doshiae]SUV45657.1 Uncharacterised protein [Bartonella doshiae]